MGDTLMEMVDFGHGVPPLSRLIYGVWRLADDMDTSDKNIRAKIEACLEKGITTFDHADIYGDYSCEALFGRVIKAHPELKDRMQIITKCDIMLMSAKFPQRRVKHYDTSAAHIRASVDTSLGHIGCDVIDMLLLHRPDPFMDHRETGAALDALIDEGKIRGVGVSNFMPWDIDLLQSAMKHPIQTNQIEISLAARDGFTNGQIAKAQMDGKPLMAWSPLAGGSLFIPNNEIGKRVMPKLLEIGNRHDVAADAVAIAWLLAHPSTILPIIGTNTLERIRHITDALKVEIDRETWFELWTLAAGQEVP
ncbi:MAG: aldo/keto reductase [Pseudomonadota bacterium]